MNLSDHLIKQIILNIKSVKQLVPPNNKHSQYIDFLLTLDEVVFIIDSLPRKCNEK